jgi:hypothetical protein
MFRPAYPSHPLFPGPVGRRTAHANSQGLPIRSTRCASTDRDRRTADRVRQSRRLSRLVFLLERLTDRASAFSDRRDGVCGPSFGVGPRCCGVVGTPAVVPRWLSSAGSLS